MSAVVLFVLACAILVLLRGALARKRAWLAGPNDTEHLQRWAAADPQIKPLALPEIKPLEARKPEPPVQMAPPLEFRSRKKAKGGRA